MVKIASGTGRVGLGAKILRVGRSTVISLEEVRLRLGGVVLWGWLVTRETRDREESGDLCLLETVEWLMIIVGRVNVDQFISGRRVGKRRRGEARRR